MMQIRVTRKWLRNGFLLSVLLHVLLLSTSLVIVFPVEEKKPPHYYVPSYVYTGAITPSTSTPLKSAAKTKVEAQQRVDKTQLKNESQPQVEKHLPPAKQGIYHTSMLAASYAALKANQFEAMVRPETEQERILLVGDMSTAADPLIKMMGRSLSAHFNYPQTEGMLGRKGRVLIELTLNPDGTYSNVQIVQSSDNQNLDAAALYAVNKAPIVEGADRFLNQPKHFVVGFIFD